MIFIATFYSHFGAMRCKKECDKAGISARLMPVPRMLSSSCGTCVRIESEDAERIPRTEESEQIAAEEAGGYRILWKAEES
ncbi:MAG: DUF3343 domain-containing protein [Eubacteriales bacterium]|jgi:hypothetical protein|nr:DUF3343 domain-containing protein [Clostridia bacterium]MBQ9401152.1 DUF3343 domain-containing protein [Clostridia bacterium]